MEKLKWDEVYKKEKNIHPDILGDGITRFAEEYSYQPEVLHFSILPFNNNHMFDAKYSKIQFNISSANLLDPYSFYVELEVENPNQNAIQLDGSAHSLISELSIYGNGQLIEEIKEYDYLMNLRFDMELNRSERHYRHKNEGFGYNSYGTNETVIYPKGFSYDEAVKNNSLSEKVKNIIEDVGVTFDASELRNYARGGMLKEEEIDNFLNKTWDLDKEPFESINKWEVVSDGKLGCIKETSDVRNKKTFKIPIMSRVFGFGQPQRQYKLIPLNIYKSLIVVIKLNPDAFFVPVPVSKLEFFKIHGGGKTTEELFRESMALEQVSNYYKITNAVLHTDQLIFPKSIMMDYENRVNKGEYIFEDLEYEIMEHDQQSQLKNTYTIQRTYERSGVRSIYMTLRNDLYNHSKYARKNARYNKGYSKISFKQGNYVMPLPGMDEKKNNSLNTHGLENARDLYEKYVNTRYYKDTEKTLVSYRNWCIDYDASHIMALKECDKYKRKITDNGDFFLSRNYFVYDSPDSIISKRDAIEYLKEESVKEMINSLTIRVPGLNYMRMRTHDMNENLELPTSKCIHVINFETLPYTGGKYNFTGAAEMRAMTPQTYTLTRHPTAYQSDIFTEGKHAQGVFWTWTLLFESTIRYMLEGDGKVYMYLPDETRREGLRQI